MATRSISAKNLGGLALADNCPRCSWMQIQLAFKLPFQIFPGIFSSIDSYTKRMVNQLIESDAGSPAWLAPLGTITASIDTPHFSKFNVTFDKYDIRLTGALDALFRLADDTLCVADYKTAKFTGHQDHLLPMYAVQLNEYAVIAEQLGMGHVSKLSLIYFEPETDVEHVSDAQNARARGFALGFSAHVLDLELNPDKWLFPYLQQARELIDSTVPPAAGPACRNCEQVNAIMELLRE